ncbi:hypothetical protein MBLNU230_g7872t1 [Neophaeotheca triangularis]
MLLTQSQVSVVVSSIVVFVFTFLLFISGYILQQQTVQELQQAIKPRLPPPPPSLALDSHVKPLAEDLERSRLFGGSLGSKGHVAYQKFVKLEQNPSHNVDWKRLAHIQLVRNHHDVCNALMLFGELHRSRSPARRVLLFPQAWALENNVGKGDILDPFLDITRRLLRSAARRYKVELRPTAPVIDGNDDEGRPEVYSLASAYALSDFDRVMSIETPGLIRDASPLDAALAFTEPAPFAMLHDTVAGDGVHSEDIFLFQPSVETHDTLLSQLEAYATFNDTLLSTAFPEPLLLASSSESSALVRSIAPLHQAGPGFNATAFLSDAAYIRFSDPKLPGPEYDVPWSSKLAARPKNKDADWVWTKLYGQFAQKRMEMCGLDLEPWRG